MDKLTIKTFAVSNYKSIADCTLDFSKGVLGLIGENATGKSNIGRALETYFTLIRDIIPNQLQDQKWDSAGRNGLLINNLDSNKHNPYALLSVPDIGTSIEFIGVFHLPAHIAKVLSPVVGVAGQDLNELEIRFRLVLVSTTDRPVLQPTVWIKINSQTPNATDIKKLGIWGQFTMERARAVRPLTQVFSDMSQMRNSGVPGRNDFARVNKEMKSLHNHFAEIDYINNIPTGILGDIQGLDETSMSSGNLQTFNLLSSFAKSKSVAKVMVTHIEEPELSLHPHLQRTVVRKLVSEARNANVALSIETHSPNVLAELFSQGYPVYRVHSSDSGSSTVKSLSRATALATTDAVINAFKSIGSDAGFIALGGVLIITCGSTDIPVYKEFLSRFQELNLTPYTFLASGGLKAKGLDLMDVAKLAPRTIVVADGHFIKEKMLGERLQEKCVQAGVTYIQIERWGVENFFPKELFGNIPTIKVIADTFDPMKKIDTLVQNYSKEDHGMKLATFVERNYLEAQPDFMRLVTAIQGAEIS